ncbi:hypothetical protein [Sulfuricurvum sp.]|uniref:hypothetical protein n=1 Tax=Sulfuricurvum sp. TaxID=2025608 RepID=UPI003BAEC8C3
MSKRQTIIDAIVTRLSALKVSDGIVRVDEWIVHKLNEKEMPAIVVRDVSSKVDSSGGSLTHSLSIEIDILVTESTTTMTRLRQIMSSVLTAIGAEGDDLLEYRAYEGDDILAEHQDHFYGGARMKFSVDYSTVAWAI